MENTMVDAPIPLEPLIKRRLVWDILPCPSAPGAMGNHGLVPGSPGGNNLEHRQSHSRLNAIKPILDDIKAHSELAGDVVGRSILESQGREVSDTDPQLAHYRNIITASTQAVIANLISVGVLRLDEGMTV